ncbi:MAG: hypothetical protein KBD82_00945 [Rhodoferax sp.]|uniref:hypothetical protein n=1 Tax=Rhodoferax sp. TaxID=50421 RepID=UPI001B6477D3|nr:hypothetical protein [Rhodoferax sp.]MBP9734208.1 hypothetical protein [Rhodoferax sp.]
MENMTILALAGCVVSAAAVFVFMQFQRYEERQIANDQMLKMTTELESVKAKLLGFSKYSEYLAPAKLYLSEQAKSLGVTVVRDYVQVDRLLPEKDKIKSEVMLIGKYQVEFSLAIDLKPESFELNQDGTGITIKTGLPVLKSPPLVKSASHDLSLAGVVANEAAVFTAASQKFSSTAQSHGLTVAREDTVRALCKAKLLDALRDFLSRQPGVRALPMVVLNFH